MLAEEGDDLPAVYVFPRRLAEGVVAAAQPDGVERVSGASHAFDGIAREVCGESEIVALGDEADGTRDEAFQFFRIGERADGRPVVAQFVERDGVCESGANV